MPLTNPRPTQAFSKRLAPCFPCPALCGVFFALNASIWLSFIPCAMTKSSQKGQNPMAALIRLEPCAAVSQNEIHYIIRAFG
jgi:hypothetical protein